MTGVGSIIIIKTPGACSGDEFRNICSSSAFPPGGKFTGFACGIFPIQGFWKGMTDGFAGQAKCACHLGTMLAGTTNQADGQIVDDLCRGRHSHALEPANIGALQL